MWFTKQEINLIRELTWIEFKLRYNASILGFFWSLLNPLLMLSILYLVFSVLIRNDIAYYPIFLLIGIILWNFFAESTTNSAAIIITKSPLINKIYFKREILVIATCITTFITLLLNLIILGIFMIISKIGFNLVLLYSIFILLNLFLLSLGLSFGLAAFYTKFRDLQHIWRVLLQAGFFITPIIISIFFSQSIINRMSVGLKCIGGSTLPHSTCE